MNWLPLQAKLEQLLNVKIHITEVDNAVFTEAKVPFTSDVDSSLQKAIIDCSQYYALEFTNTKIIALQIASQHLSATEQRLIEYIISTFQAHSKQIDQVPVHEEISIPEKFTKWIEQCIRTGDVHSSIPEALVFDKKLQSPQIPLVMQRNFIENQRVTDEELKKLLETFFAESILLLPMNSREWLILVSDQILLDVHEQMAIEEELADETVEHKLYAIAEGLHEMLVNEWIGECDLAIHYPIIPVQQMVSVYTQMRESLKIGRKFHNKHHIYPTWQLAIEKLIYTIPEQERERFIHEVIKPYDLEWDEDIMLTIDCFVNSNCNVSQTAKKLYMHRNTLLYRLDKFKQMTGHDVREFEDAIRVKLALLLYKLTKNL